VLSTLNGLRAAAENGIRRRCDASSIDAIGLAYANQPLRFPYFPADEDYPLRETDAYALENVEGETAAHTLVEWFPGIRIAGLRIYGVALRKNVLEEHWEDRGEAGVRQLWSWDNRIATATAYLLSVTQAGTLKRCEVFSILAPGTTQDTPWKDLAAKCHPHTTSWADMTTNRAFWTTGKAESILGYPGAS
jgi:hypothetical protein